MDVDLARTFLTITETAHFGKAARAMNVTQSTISARIKTLEDLLGQPLFVRSKTGTTLTPAGSKFKGSAEMMIRIWEQARQQVGTPSEYQSMISVAGELTLWDQLLLRWLPWMRSSLPDVAVRAEILQLESLMHRLAEGSIDLGVLYAPINRPGLEVETLLDEELVLVSTGNEAIVPGHRSYVFVDWGTSFRLDHENAYPSADTPALTVSPSQFGLTYILENGGAGYFPTRLVREPLDSGHLRIADAAPRFRHRVYMIYNNDRNDERFNTALQGLRFIAARETED
jgi:DNA-binding transcriptional LysR family regulator